MRNYFMTTERCGFSQWKADDLELARSLWGDEKVTRFICASGQFSGQEIEERLKTEIKNGELFHVQYWPVFSLATNELIGCCGLRPYDLTKGAYELGFHIRTSYWGQKYAYETALAVIRYAFDELNAETIVAGHHPQNSASRKVLTRLGFQYSHDEYYPPTGLDHPSYRYSKDSQSHQAG